MTNTPKNIMPPKVKKHRYNFTISPKHEEIIVKISKIENRSLSEVVEFALETLDKQYGS
jgi:hypothetical protein